MWFSQDQTRLPPMPRFGSRELVWAEKKKDKKLEFFKSSVITGHKNDRLEAFV